jgi:hypothetical protein
MNQLSKIVFRYIIAQEQEVSDISHHLQDAMFSARKLPSRDYDLRSELINLLEATQEEFDLILTQAKNRVSAQ